MKNFVLVTVMTLGFSLFANAQKIEFVNLEQNNTLNYGEIEKSADGLRVIEFKNVGDAPLILSNVKASCGCTVPTYEDKPVMPGKTAEIKVKYNTTRLGPINKVITITSNDLDSPTTLVRLKGKVNGAVAANTSARPEVSKSAPAKALH